MQLDLAAGIREEVAKIHGGGGIGGFAVAGVGNVEFRALNGSARHTVLLEDRQLRGLVVAEHQCPFIAGVQADGLYPVFVLIRQVVGRGDGLLCNLIGAGDHSQGHFAILAGGPIVLIVPVDGLNRKHSAGDGLAAVGVNLGDRQLRLLQILENDLLLVAAVQADGLRGFIADAVRLRDGLLRDPVAARGHPQLHGAAGLGGDLVAVVPINGLQEKDGAGDGFVGALLDFGNLQKGLLLVIENELLVVASLQPNGLGGFVADYVGVRDGNFRHFVTVNRDASQRGGAVRPGGHVMVKSVMDTMNLKIGVGNYVPGFSVPLQNREVRELLVSGSNRDGAASVDGGLIDVCEHRLVQLGIGGRGGYLDEGVHTLGHIRHGDGPIRSGFLGADDLPVLDDVEHSAGERIVGIIQLDELDLYLGVVLEN